MPSDAKKAARADDAKKATLLTPLMLRGAILLVLVLVVCDNYLQRQAVADMVTKHETLQRLMGTYDSAQQSIKEMKAQIDRSERRLGAYDRAQKDTLDKLRAKLKKVESRLGAYSSLEPRVDNPPWQEEIEAVKQKRLAHEVSEEFTDELFATANRFPHGHNLTSWEAMLDRTTPSAFADDGTTEDAPASWCTDLAQVVISEAELSQQPLTSSTRDRAWRALTQCGYVYLDNLLSAEKVKAFREAYEAFKARDDSNDFVYPCQGAGRIEHLLPFEPPFNNTDAVYADPRLRALLSDFLGDSYKLELMTVINSPPGTGNQRWHQGWRYLFHPDERLPPFAVVVGLPLADVTYEMGPTEMCPGEQAHSSSKPKPNQGTLTLSRSSLSLPHTQVRRGASTMDGAAMSTPCV